jgi:hypothetical protein
MPLDQKTVISQIDTILDQYNGLRKRSLYDDLSDLAPHETSEIVTLFIAAIERLAPPGRTLAITARW